jgi:hypothetical protein
VEARRRGGSEAVDSDESRQVTIRRAPDDTSAERKAHHRQRVRSYAPICQTTNPQEPVTHRVSPNRSPGGPTPSIQPVPNLPEAGAERDDAEVRKRPVRDRVKLVLEVLTLAVVSTYTVLTFLLLKETHRSVDLAEHSYKNG